MTRNEIHNELSLLGVSSEVHKLVDDLDLDFGVPRLSFKQMIKHRTDKLPYKKSFCHVYESNPYYKETIGRLF